MSTAAAAALTLVVLAAGGAVPCVVLCRSSWVAVPLAPLTGALFASLAVTGVTAVGGAFAGWYVALCLAAALGAAGLIWRRHRAARALRADTGPEVEAAPRPRRSYPWVGPVAVVGAAAASAFSLRMLENPVVAYDARAIWMRHAAWYLAGHHVVVAALRNPALVYTHPQYPPLFGASVALSWLISGTHAVRLGVVLGALLSALAVMTVAVGVAELARAAVVGPTLSPGPFHVRRGAVLAVGLLLSPALCLAVFGAAGTTAVDGHADLLWAAAACGAVAIGLVAPWSAGTAAAASLLAAVAGTSKLEGEIVAGVIVVLMVGRGVLARRSAGVAGSWRLPVAMGLATGAVIGAWPLVMRLLHALPNQPWSGARRGNDLTRLRATLHAADPHLLVALGAVVAVAGGVALRRVRRALGWGDDLWTWGAFAVAALVLVGSYVVGPGDVRYWLDDSIQRTVLFPVVAAWTVVGVWSLVAAASFGRDVRASGADAPPVPGDEPSEAPRAVGTAVPSPAPVG